jgi:hypothetical protein
MEALQRNLDAERLVFIDETWIETNMTGCTAAIVPLSERQCQQAGRPTRPLTPSVNASNAGYSSGPSFLAVSSAEMTSASVT